MDIKGAKTFLRENDNFLVSSHLNADGDAIASVLAFRIILKKMRKNFRMILHDKRPDDKYDFLPGFGEIASFKDEMLDRHKAQKVILLDTPSTERAGTVAQIIEENASILNIDHHESNTQYGTLNLIESHASATAQIIYLIVMELGMEFDEKLASCIYTGIMFDTGRFMFSNTSEEALNICAQMVRNGAKPNFIAKAVYGNRTLESVVMLGKALNSLDVHLDGRVCSIMLRNSDYRLNEDADQFVDYVVSIEGVEVSLFFKEYEQSRFRVSLRSSDKVNVSQIAKEFGGGGHPNAAGCQIDGMPEDVKSRLIEAIKDHL